MGVSLLTGFTGIFTLGHAAYMALGAYTTAILTVQYGVHWFLAILAGGVISMTIAYLIGIPTLKLMGDYYAIASIGVVDSIRLILENWQSLTKGAEDIPALKGLLRYRWLIFLVVMTIGMINLINSRYGRAFKACRDDYLAASLLGYNTAFIKF